MKILILTPFWKRPEIVREYVRSIERFPIYARDSDNVFVDFKLLAIVSPEDPHCKEILDILPKETYINLVKNQPFGRKKNSGVEAAKALKWDYLLELNSDSIVNPALFDLYKPYMEKKTPFFGLKNLFVVDYKTKRSLFLPSYNSGMTYGAGRMLYRDALKCKLWTDELNEGMDTNMMTRLRDMGIHETVIDNGDIPMVVDLKTNTTLSHITFLENIKGAEESSYEYIKKHIGYDFISS